MPAYALLLRPAANRLYSKGAAALNAAEMAVLDERVLDASLQAVAPAVIGGVEYVRFETADLLTPHDVAHLSNLSSAFALFRITDDGDSLVPVTLTPVAHLDDDLLTIQRYKGKTNEQFTKLLFNVTLAASAQGRDWPGQRLRILDPVCGRGTSLNQGLVYGFDVDGIEIDRAAYDAYQTFFVTWLKDKRFKHQVHTMPLRRETKIVGRRLEVVFARDKDEYKADDVQRVRLVNDDTTQAGEHYRKPVFDAVIGDLPYGVQHASRTKSDGRAKPDARNRRPDDLLDAALDGWIGAMKPGAAIGLSWNVKVLKRDELVGVLGQHGLTLASPPEDTSFEHRVDQSITRDLVVAVKP
ncbi:MAG TPA: SAM-dependent methyltransferase [Acidimicrobiia bacterium]|nr:SAM-dependent methyltransferase [Acidimicrobiia bacterium]